MSNVFEEKLWRIHPESNFWQEDWSIIGNKSSQMLEVSFSRFCTCRLACTAICQCRRSGARYHPMLSNEDVAERVGSQAEEFQSKYILSPYGKQRPNNCHGHFLCMEPMLRAAFKNNGCRDVQKVPTYNGE